MSIVFNKGVLVLETLQKFLMNITKANNFNIEIKDVILYDVMRYEKLANANIPAIFMSAEETIERETNEEFVSDMTVQMFVMYQPEDQANGVITDFSKLITAIGTQIDASSCLGLSFIEEINISAIQHPLYLDTRQAFSFLLTVTIRYFYDANDP